MNQEISRREQENISLDFSFIFRRLWRNIFVILMCACITGVAAYVGLDYYMNSSYTSTMELAMIVRDNSASRLSDGNLNTAMTRNLNVLNSEMLTEQMRKDESIADIPGTVSASQITDTNLISLSASSDSAENAMRLLKSAMDSYPTLTGYFESGYMLRELTGLSVDNIREIQPRAAYYAALGVLLVLAAGVGLTVFFCVSTDRLHSREQAEAVLDAPVIGTLHFTRKKRKQKAILISSPMADGVYVEEIDKLATRVQDRMEKDGQKILMVNSIRENEGKSTVAVNLALNLVRRGKKVMLIDTDMRRPAVAKILDRTVEKGKSLSDFLQGNSSLEKVMCADPELKNLRYIFQAEAVGEPDKLLEDRDFRQLLQKVSAHMDFVILDTAPIGIVRDAEIIAGASDAVLLVIRQDGVRGAEVNDVVDVLDETGTSILGAVMNMDKSKNRSAGRRRGYGKYYYGYENKRREQVRNYAGRNEN